MPIPDTSPPFLPNVINGPYRVSPVGAIFLRVQEDDADKKNQRDQAHNNRG